MVHEDSKHFCVLCGREISATQGDTCEPCRWREADEAHAIAQSIDEPDPYTESLKDEILRLRELIKKAYWNCSVDKPSGMSCKQTNSDEWQNGYARGSWEISEILKSEALKD